MTKPAPVDDLQRRVGPIVDALLELSRVDAEAAIKLWRRRLPAPDLSWLRLSRVSGSFQSTEYEYSGYIASLEQDPSEWLVAHYPVRVEVRSEGHVYGRNGHLEPTHYEIRVTSPVRISEIAS